MNSLVIKNLTLDSREVAEMVDKNHAHLLRGVEAYKQCLGESKFGFTKGHWKRPTVLHK